MAASEGKTRRSFKVSDEPYAKNARELVKSQEELVWKLQDLKIGIEKIFRELRREKENTKNQVREIFIETPNKNLQQNKTANHRRRSVAFRPENDALVENVPRLRRAYSVDRGLQLGDSICGSPFFISAPRMRHIVQNYVVSTRARSVAPDYPSSPYSTSEPVTPRYAIPCVRASSVAPEMFSSSRESLTTPPRIVSSVRARSVAPEALSTPRYFPLGSRRTSIVERACSLAPEYSYSPRPIRQGYSPLIRASSSRAASLAPDFISPGRAPSMTRDICKLPRASSTARELFC